MTTLAAIQQKLKCPKSQYNQFGKFAFRNAEDILEAVKPLLGDLSLQITAKPEARVGWHYIIVEVALVDVNKNEVASATACAREQETKKGMDAAQISGACMSYAKKYALGNLFALDDGGDPDTQNNSKTTPAKGAVPPSQSPEPAPSGIEQELGDHFDKEHDKKPNKVQYPAAMEAPNPAQRQILIAISDSLKDKAPEGKKFSHQAFADEVVRQFARWPESASDAVTFAKGINPDAIYVDA